jgi:hypothetical protein
MCFEADFNDLQYREEEKLAIWVNSYVRTDPPPTVPLSLHWHFRTPEGGRPVLGIEVCSGNGRFALSSMLPLVPC